MPFRRGRSRTGSGVRRRSAQRRWFSYIVANTGAVAPGSSATYDIFPQEIRDAGFVEPTLLRVRGVIVSSIIGSLPGGNLRNHSLVVAGLFGPWGDATNQPDLTSADDLADQNLLWHDASGWVNADEIRGTAPANNEWIVNVPSHKFVVDTRAMRKWSRVDEHLYLTVGTWDTSGADDWNVQSTIFMRTLWLVP